MLIIVWYLHNIVGKFFIGTQVWCMLSCFEIIDVDQEV